MFNKLSLVRGVGLMLLAIFLLIVPPAYAGPQPLLNLSHIACAADKVEVHFVVVNLPDGVTPLALTFFGSWPGGTGSGIIPAPTQISGPVYHYSFFGQDGFYEITGASLALSDGSSLSLHNPGEFTGTYQCHCFGMANCDGWEFHFFHPLKAGATIEVFANIGGQWIPVGSGAVDPTAASETVVTGPWTAPVPARETAIKFVVVYGSRTHVERAIKPECPR